MMNIPHRITRRRDWKARLSAYVAAQHGLVFGPSEPACAIFAAGAVEAMTGHDLAAAFKGRSRTVERGLAALRAAGFDDHIALVAARFDEVHPAFAQPGDVAVMAGADGIPALGIVQGEFVYAVTPERRLGLVPRSEINRVFRV